MRRLRIYACWLVAALCLTVSGWDFVRWLRMSTWPVAPGRVVYSDTSMQPAGGKSRYSPEIEIEYPVAGAVYKTRSVRADSAMTSWDRTWADRIVNVYPKGRPVEVHYRPENPADARVEIAPQPALLVLAVWGLCALFSAWWMTGRRAPQPAPVPLPRPLAK